MDRPDRIEAHSESVKLHYSGDMRSDTTIREVKKRVSKKAVKVPTLEDDILSMMADVTIKEELVTLET